MKRFAVMLVLGLVGCGGAGGSSALPAFVNHQVPSGSSASVLSVTPVNAEGTMTAPQVLTIAGGVAPYTVDNGCPSGSTFTLNGGTLKVTATMKYPVECSYGVKDAVGNQLAFQVTLNWPNN